MVSLAVITKKIFTKNFSGVHYFFQTLVAGVGTNGE